MFPFSNPDSYINLIDLYNYKEEDITILMDDNSGNYKKPTKDNMVRISDLLHRYQLLY